MYAQTILATPPTHSRFAIAHSFRKHMRKYQLGSTYPPSKTAFARPLRLYQASFMVPIALTFTFTFTLSFSFGIPVRLSIRLVFASSLGATLLLLYSSRHARLVIHRIEDSLHQPLVRIRIIILCVPKWRPIVLSTATALRLAHGTAG